MGLVPAINCIHLQYRIAMTFSSWIALALTVSLSATPDIPTQSVDQLVQTGTIALNDRRYAEAEAAWRAILKREPNNVNAYIQLGDTLTHLSRQRESPYEVKVEFMHSAMDAYQKAIALDPKRAEVYVKLSKLQEERGSSEEQKTYHQAIDLAEPNAEVYYRLGSRLLSDLGNAKLYGYEVDHEYTDEDRAFFATEKAKASAYLRKATQVPSQDKTYVVLAYIALADYLQETGKESEAIAAYQSAMAFNDPNAYIKYAEFLERKNRLDAMVAIYQKTLQKTLSPYSRVSLHKLLGDLFFKLDRFDEATETYRKTIALNPDHATARSVYISLGDSLKKTGKLDQAVHSYREVLKVLPDLDPNDFGTPYYEIFSAFEDRGLLDLAVTICQKGIHALDPNDRTPRLSLLHGHLGKLLSLQGKHNEAFVALRQSVLLNPYRESGKLLAEKGELEKAEAQLSSAIGNYEFLRSRITEKNKIALAEIQAITYQLLQKVLVLQNQPNKALVIAEQGRSRALAELLATRFSQKLIPNLEKSIKSPNLYEITNIAKTQNATLVEYSIIDQKQIYIWVIKPNGTITFKTSELKGSVAIAELVADSRATIRIESAPTEKSPPDFTHSLRQLHQTLIEPIATDLPTDPNHPVIFLPQGELFLVPFPALQDANGTPLIAQHTLSTAPSIQTLQLTRDRAKLIKLGNQNLVVGNPTMPIFQNAQLRDLPGAKDEAIAIAKLLNTEPLLGNQATKSQVLTQMPKASIIHLATHGLLNSVEGDIPGAIALAPSGSDNGFLSAREIFDLTLTANLAVLSACDTGLGDITSDGVIGLSRSFIAAGVPTVIVSLWAVNDDSTNVLMSHFYRNLKTNPNKAQSLRQAMLTTLKQYPDPKYWAAFTLIGET